MSNFRKCIFSSKRRRRRRTSITAGEESEANGTCGATVTKRSVLEEGEHKRFMYSLLMFALFEDDITIFLEPQASQPTAAQPAVMDIRRLRRRLLKQEGGAWDNNSLDHPAVDSRSIISPRNTTSSVAFASSAT